MVKSRVVTTSTLKRSYLLRGAGISPGVKEGKVINDLVLANTNTGSPTASMVK